MIYIIPTKRGLGVEIWGTSDDLTILYEVISRFWNDEDKLNKKGFKSRDALISGFSYEIRKAKDGNRLKRDNSHFSLSQQTYYGTQISWVHFFFSLTAIKFNMRYKETSKLDISQILLIEYWLENALNRYDKTIAKELTAFIKDGLYGGNDYLYQYMRSINFDFYLLGGGKRAFRKLPNLLRRGIYFSDEYKDYANFLEAEAIKLKCEISELEINDDDFDYENLKW